MVLHLVSKTSCRAQDIFVPVEWGINLNPFRLWYKNFQLSVLIQKNLL